MITQAPPQLYTPDEYLQREAQADHRSEYLAGEIIPMAGGTTNHNKLALNFCRLLPLSIGEQDYEVYMSDVRLWIPRYEHYTYPDVMVVAGEPSYEDEQQTTILNPLMILEVLSRSTQGYDKTDKFKHYRSIPEFREYVLVDQYSMAVEQYAKTANGQWILTEVEGSEAVLNLTTMDWAIALPDLYNRVDLPPT